MALIIAGERSGVGKTTVTLALLAALQQKQTSLQPIVQSSVQFSVQSFKVGPDYIDPMFHEAITGRACRNLDTVLTSEAYVQWCFKQHSQDATYALVEGVMGLFDGATGANDWGSTAHIARLLDLPILLVVNCSSLSRSVAAIVHGYCSFDPRLKFAGVVLNRVGSDRHLNLLKTALEPLQLPVLGVLRRQDQITIPDRHLGLIPTAELNDLPALIDRLANLGEQSFNWDQLLPLLSAEPLPPTPAELSPTPPPSISPTESRLEQHPPPTSPHTSTPRLAIAQDRAFSFYYRDNLDLLQQLGAELVFWSPIQDNLPTDVSGLYFGGGFPEVFAAELAANQMAQKSVRAAILSGMPTYAECGGLMYLTESVIDFSGQAWAMVGVLPTVARMGKRLSLGYRRATAQFDTPLLAAGTTVWGHEFHRSGLTQPSDAPLYQLQGYDSPSPQPMEGWQTHNLHASYVHLHWGARPEIPARFVAACVRFAQSQS